MILFFSLHNFEKELLNAQSSTTELNDTVESANLHVLDLEEGFEVNLNTKSCYNGALC